MTKEMEELLKSEIKEFGWEDGFCKTCGSIVLEVNCRECDLEEARFSDYVNMCSNEKCEHYVLHFVGDQEILDYYKHN
jgi:hypothetical protein